MLSFGHEQYTGKGRIPLAVITDSHRQKIRQMFESGLQRQVEILFFGAEGGESNEYSQVTWEIVTELMALSDGKLTARNIAAHERPDLVSSYGIDKFPAILFLDEQGRDQHVRIYGAPIGYEFAALLEDIIDVSQQQTRLSDAARAQIKSIEQDLVIQVFSTPG